MDGGLVTGGETITFTATNLGAPDDPVYEIAEMFPGSIVPVSFPDPSTAIPYSFSTDNAPTSQDPVLETLFAGTSVSGSLSYANWVPPFVVLDGANLAGAVVYPGAMLDLTGSVNGLKFAGAVGFGIVGNERYQPLGGVDFMQLGDGALDSNFEIDDYRLIGVRWFWIETGTTPDDFLASDLLPATPPEALIGRLALDFERISDPQTQPILFFEGLALAPAP